MAGSRTPRLSPSRWILGRLANHAFRWVMARPRIGDATTSFRVARVELIRDFELGSTPIETYSVHTTFVPKAIAQGYRVGEAPIIYRPPLAGGGGLTMSDIREFGAHPLACAGDAADPAPPSVASRPRLRRGPLRSRRRHRVPRREQVLLRLGARRVRVVSARARAGGDDLASGGGRPDGFGIRVCVRTKRIAGTRSMFAAVPSERSSIATTS